MSAVLPISVVTVVLNGAPLIGAAMASLVSQKHPALEWVVVDGGSTDGTQDIVRRCTELPSTLISGPDAGIYDAMNKGLAAARGEALFFLNADDRFADPEALSRLAQALEAGAADLAFGDIVVFGDGHDRLRSHRHVRPARLGHESLSHQAVLARRSCFARVGDFDTRYRICADLDWFMRCADAGLHFVHVPSLVCRCMAGGESSRRYALQMQERRELIARHQAPLQRHAQRLAAGLRRRWATPDSLP